MSNLNYIPELLRILYTELCSFNVKLKACGGTNGQKQAFEEIARLTGSGFNYQVLPFRFFTLQPGLIPMRNERSWRCSLEKFGSFLCKLVLITSVAEDKATPLSAQNFRNQLLMQELCETFKWAQLW